MADTLAADTLADICREISWDYMSLIWQLLQFMAEGTNNWIRCPWQIIDVTPINSVRTGKASNHNTIGIKALLKQGILIIVKAM